MDPSRTAGLTPGTVHSMIITTVDSGGMDAKTVKSTNTYPYALFKNNTANNYKRKKAAFTGVANLTIVTPSRWLADEVKHVFLKRLSSTGHS